jgi:hypothetical protein
MKSVLKYLKDPLTLAKFWFIASTTLVGAIAQGLIVGHAAMWLTLIIGAVGSAGVFAVPNKRIRSGNSEPADPAK